jgi:hypothetical protein
MEKTGMGLKEMPVSSMGLTDEVLNLSDWENGDSGFSNVVS